MIVLDNKGLKGCLQKIIQNANNRGVNDLYLFLKTLEATGLRGQEVKNYMNWLLVSKTVLKIPSHKRGDVKYIQTDTLEKELINAIEMRNNKLFKGSVKTYRREFKRFNGATSLYCGQKEITLHAFRHSFIKQKYQGGMSTAQIQGVLGIKSPAIVTGYINSNIYIK